MQQIQNIAKVEDNDCNSLTVEVDSDASDGNYQKKQKRRQTSKKKKKTKGENQKT